VHAHARSDDGLLLFGFGCLRRGRFLQFDFHFGIKSVAGRLSRVLFGFVIPSCRDSEGRSPTVMNTLPASRPDRTMEFRQTTG
jgi:hypothetical protein